MPRNLTLGGYPINSGFWCDTCSKVVRNVSVSQDGDLQHADCTSTVEPVADLHQRQIQAAEEREKVMRMGAVWKHYAEHDKHAPITETGEFEEVIALLIAEFEGSCDNGEMILDRLRTGALRYLENSIDVEDEHNYCSNTERELEAFNRNRDLKRELSTGVYGWRK